MIAIDVGGTFTDTIAVDEKGNVIAAKVPTDMKATENSQPCIDLRAECYFNQEFP